MALERITDMLASSLRLVLLTYTTKTLHKTSRHATDEVHQQSFALFTEQLFAGGFCPFFLPK